MTGFKEWVPQGVIPAVLLGTALVSRSNATGTQSERSPPNEHRAPIAAGNG